MIPLADNNEEKKPTILSPMNVFNVWHKAADLRKFSVSFVFHELETFMNLIIYVLTWSKF